jgi:hypothetical protein
MAAKGLESRHAAEDNARHSHESHRSVKIVEWAGTYLAFASFRARGGRTIRASCDVSNTPTGDSAPIVFKSFCSRCGGDRMLTATATGSKIVLPSACSTKDQCELELVRDYYVRTQ